MSDPIYKAILENSVWSYSKINCFVDCPYRFFLIYILETDKQPRFYASYGSFMHKIIEQLSSEKIDKRQALDIFLKKFSTEVEGARPKSTTVEKYIRNGVEYLKEYHPFQYKPIALEGQAKFDIDGIPFIGYIDYLGIDDDGDLHIIDHKSRNLKPRSKRSKPTIKDRELDETLRQLYIYSVWVKARYGKYPKTLCLNCFRAGTFIEEEFDETKLEEAKIWAKNTINTAIINTDEFNPYIDYFSCRYICDVSEECMYAGG